MPDIDRPWQRDLDCVKASLVQLIEANDRRYTDGSLSDRRALLQGLDASNKRLDALAEARGPVNDAIGRMIPREEFEAGRQSSRDKMDQQQSAWESRFSAEIRPLEGKLETLGRTNWPLLASMISIFLVIVGGVWVLIGLKMEATIAPVAMTLEQVRTGQNINTIQIAKSQENITSSTAADVQSRTDREQLNGRVGQIERSMASGLAERRAAQATVNAKLIEIETQFCAADSIRNINLAQDMRLLALLWRKVYPDAPLPTDNAFYPQVCNRQQSNN